MEPWLIQGGGIFLLLLILLALGVNVAVAMWTAGIAAGLWLWGFPGLVSTASTSFSATAKFIMIPVTLFIFMGELLSRSGLGEKTFAGIEVWIGHIPGGLAIATIITCVLIAACTGLSPAATALLAPMALPPMLKRGYDKRLAVGLVAGSSALAILIPPGILMVLYGAFSGVPISHMFIGGVMPGLMTALIFILYVLFRVYLKPDVAPRFKSSVSLKQRIVGTWDVFPLVLLITVVLGSIYLGLATPSEAAAAGSLAIIILMYLYQRTNWSVFKTIFLETVRANSMIFFIVTGASYFSQILAYVGFTENVAKSVAGLPMPGISIIIAMMAVLIVLGCFLDPPSIFFITTPLFVPIVDALGFNLLWYGILFIINMEIANITPPVGMNLFVMKAVAPQDVTMSDVIAGCAPFWFLYSLSMALIMAFPQIATWLPSFLGAR